MEEPDTTAAPGRPAVMDQAALDNTVGHIRNLGAAGAHLSVARNAQVAESCQGWLQTFTDNRVCAPRGLSTDAVYDLGSVTKVFATTAMLMTLAARERLDMDLPVHRLLPGFAHESTLTDLLQHRAGLWEWWPTYVGTNDALEALQVVCDLPLRYRPRTARHYSDLGFMLLGRVVERVVGLSLSDAFCELVTEPLGLDDVWYAAPPPTRSAVPTSPGDRNERRMLRTGQPYPVGVSLGDFTRWRRQVLVGEVNDGNAFHAFGGAAGHAGLFASVSGLQAFGRALLRAADGEGPWGRALVERFWAPGPDAGQALGFRSWASRVGSCRARYVGHTGFPGIAVGVLPEHDVSVVLATNRLHVLGNPASFTPMWRTAMHAVHTAMHHQEGR